MPNYCDNSLYITFPDDETYSRLMEAWEKSKAEEKGFFQAVFPMPDKIEIENDGIMPDWWVWRNDNWGTKWDVDGDFELIHDGDLSYSAHFNTAWGPPLGVYEKLVDEWKCEVKAIYYEPGCDFCGIWDNGKNYSEDCISIFCKTYSPNNENYSNSLWSDLYEQVQFMFDEEDESDEEEEDEEETQSE